MPTTRTWATRSAGLRRRAPDRIHIDVMDGHFVPNLTFGPKMIAGIRKRTELPLDAHLMISHPLKYIDEFLDAGCDSVTFHVEVAPKQIAPTIEKIHAKGRAAGLAVKPKTPLQALEPYRTTLDIILVMTVEPGFGGQEFMRDVAKEKLLAARDYLKHKPHGAEVHVDGGVNRETAEFVGGLGVDILVVGSVLWIPGGRWAARSASCGPSPTRATSTGSTTASRRSRATRWSRSPSCRGTSR